ncbi:PAP/25A associated domain protein [Ostertagia ostertagi]
MLLLFLSTSSDSNNLTSGTQSFAAAAASGLSSCVQASVASATAAATTATTAAAATTTVETPITAPTCPTPPTSQLSRGVQFEISEMDVLSEEIWHYHNSVTQSEKMLNRKLHLRDMLYYSICPVFPMCGLYVVGSSLNGFGNNTSDMDLCLMITNKDLDQKTDAVVVLNMILSTLQHTEWVSHQKLILAKVPILRIKFAPPFSDITVDLNANNSVAIKNTHLLCYYSSFDWRVRPLVSVVKEWAKRKGINDANRSSFTSYSLVLMVIHYLQCGTEPGVLPSLQQMFPRRFANKCDVRTLNVTLPLEPPTASEWQYADKSTLGELLIGFLDYYANKFDYDRDAISVRLGKRIDRAVIARQRPNGGYQQNGTNWRSQWRCICIEEPFTYSNTAHSIYDEMVFDAIKTAFREAHQELDTTRDLQRLLNCKPITVNAPMGGAMVYVSSYSSTREMSAGSTAGDSPMSGHSRRSTPRGSSSGSSISTAHSAASSSGSSSSSDYGEDQDHDRLTDVADVSGVPLQRQTKARSRRISRPNGSIPSCLPTSPPKIPVTTAAEQ